MKGKLSSAVDQLEKWVIEGKNVLVHCQSGISRSATVVIAYVMKKHQIPLIQAYSLVIEKRPVINPNDGFFRALQDFEEKTVVDLKVDKHR